MAAKSSAPGAQSAANEPAGVESSALDDIVASLYAVDLDTFMAERTATVKRLRSEGSRDLATAVGKVRKPILAAWALDAAARADADAVAALVDIGERLRAAQDALLDGGSPADLRAALDERRSIIRPLAEDAVARVDAAGGNGEGARDDIVATLEAASLDAAVASELGAGRLAKTTRGPVGFDFFGLGGAAAEPSSGSRSAKSDAKTDDEEEERAQARKRADEARAVADAAQAEVDAKRVELERLEAALEHAQRDVDQARAALADAEHAASAAHRAADKAERANR